MDAPVPDDAHQLLHGLANDLGGLLLDLQLTSEQLEDGDPLRARLDGWVEQVETAAARTTDLWAALRRDRS